MTNKFDAIVIGGGHAGVEAAHAVAKMGFQVALMTMNPKALGRLSCNPAIGGSAKGHIVREIDALGGTIGFLADKSGIQFKTLNKSKGPAIWSPRSQNDKDLHPLYVHEYISKIANIQIIKETAKEILIDGGKACGVETLSGEILKSKIVILCAGTFLNGVMFTGESKSEGGRIGEPASYYLSD